MSPIKCLLTPNYFKKKKNADNGLFFLCCKMVGTPTEQIQLELRRGKQLWRIEINESMYLQFKTFRHNVLRSAKSTL